MKTTFHYFLLLLPLVLFTACDDDDKKTTNPVEQLPPATQTGKNTFGCLINGKAFGIGNSYHFVAMYQGGGLFIGGQKNRGLLTHVNMLINESSIGEPITAGSIYILNSTTSPKGEYYIGDCFYTTSSTYTGTIEITHFDTINYIVSGKFEFKVTSDECEDDEIINITDGRFDMQYIP